MISGDVPLTRLVPVKLVLIMKGVERGSRPRNQLAQEKPPLGAQAEPLLTEDVAKVENWRLVCSEPHLTQITSSRLLVITSFSKRAPHFSHLYSNRGIVITP